MNPLGAEVKLSLPLFTSYSCHCMGTECQLGDVARQEPLLSHAPSFALGLSIGRQLAKFHVLVSASNEVRHLI
jgi:hypothetical protein